MVFTVLLITRAVLYKLPLGKAGKIRPDKLIWHAQSISCFKANSEQRRI